ncbi:MAG TPA: TIGR00725 family protein [Candidatus Sulfotelmatobacter sp.]|nr:TIGR00725 family protein [Candidatus Sulfotelmatobacter sp.]
MVYIGVIGEAEPPPHLLEAAEAVGRCVAEAGAILVCGGLGGVMEAACRGAQAAGGVTIGILPGHDRREGNRYLTYAVPTGLGHARNILVVRSADAVIAVGGRFGTLSEIAYAKIEGRPVVGLDTWTLERAGLPDPILRATSPPDAVAKALAALARSH